MLGCTPHLSNYSTQHGRCEPLPCSPPHTHGALEPLTKGRRGHSLCRYHGNGATAFLLTVLTESPNSSHGSRGFHNVNMTVMTADAPSALSNLHLDCVVEVALCPSRLRTTTGFCVTGAERTMCVCACVSCLPVAGIQAHIYWQEPMIRCLQRAAVSDLSEQGWRATDANKSRPELTGPSPVLDACNARLSSLV